MNTPKYFNCPNYSVGDKFIFSCGSILEILSIEEIHNVVCYILNNKKEYCSQYCFEGLIMGGDGNEEKPIRYVESEQPGYELKKYFHSDWS